MKKHIAIYGPTASGKTQLSLEIAKNLPVHHIVNFDSCQFLNYLPSLTMKPEISPHKEYLFGFVGPEDAKYSAGDFVKQIEEIEQNIRSSKIFVGGSGFYLLCLLNGISHSNKSLNSSIMDSINNSTMAHNYQRLCALDPGHNLHHQDHYRIKNHLHFFLQHNKSIRTSLSKPVVPKSHIFNIFLKPSRDWLHNNMELRTDLLFSKMILEVIELRKIYKNFHTNIIGYEEITQYLDGYVGEKAAKDRINSRTRQYGKTQNTFLKNKIKEDLIIDEKYNLDHVIEILKQKLTLI